MRWRIAAGFIGSGMFAARCLIILEFGVAGLMN
jgi:hypothetical protein